MYLPQISCVRQLIKPNIVYKDTTGMNNHMIMGVKIGLTLTEEYKLEVFGNGVLRKLFWPKWEEVTRE